MFRYGLLIIAVAALSVPAIAQESSEPASASISDEEMEGRRAATRELLDITQVDEQFQRSIDQALSFADQIVEQDPDLSAEEKEEAKALARAGMQASMERLSWERLEPVLVEIYAEVFTTEEINGLLEFFRTPTGQAFIDKQPQLTEASFRRIGALVQAELPKIQAEVQAAIEAVETE